MYILGCLFRVIRVEWAASMTYILHMYVIEALQESEALGAYAQHCNRFQ